ncbi:MAG: HypC/HybG/HupF family hydrogenase formation chaperone [Elusimicrobia bacterium]|nr:HypC/HybG/HupF family hydrogenase formation chaperone [Candidatus Liberimonas magnetica]
MCLAIPGKIIKINKDKSAIVDFGGVKRSVQLTLLPVAKLGDYVIVHAGFAIQKLKQKDAETTLSILQKAFNN